ncbi:unnamed protein product [Nippostrongylus brasiliensis]|uniref:CPG4 domain-containing protein n=1 Tax=Nippostrongylus brasiliensis TaxID=27835 RepID=A0A0N4YMV3_NIPBR|nr:unnamed protein product [Nippostrongylus brasiliensis]
MILVKSLLLILCIHVLEISTAPINAASTNFLTSLMGSFRGPNAINITQFLSTFQMPACMKQCLPELDGLLTLLSKNDTNSDLAAICSELQSSTHCASSAGCSKVFVEATASAFKFVCLDNVQDASENNLDAVLDVPRLCNSTRCLLSCFKNKVDSKCRIGEKNLLESLLSAVMRGEYHGFDDALDWIMPESCRAKPARRPNADKEKVSANKPNASQNPTKDNRVPIDKSKSAGDGKPMTVRLPPATKDSKNAAKAVETALIIDGEHQLLPFQFPPARPRESVVLPPTEEKKADEKKLSKKKSGKEEKEKRERADDQLEVVSVENDVKNDGAGIVVGLTVFIATVFYWAWETARSSD